MSVRGDWVVPTFNTGVFYDKPPLMFWLMMGSFKLLGASEFSARLPAAILAIGTALATYHLARRLFSAEVGFWAGLGDRLEHYFHGLGPGGHGRLGPGVRHHAGHGPVCQGSADRRTVRRQSASPNSARTAIRPLGFCQRRGRFTHGLEFCSAWRCWPRDRSVSCCRPLRWGSSCW